MRRLPRRWSSAFTSWRPSSATLSNQLEAASVAGDVAKVQRLGVEYQQTDAELHRVMSEWAELA